MTRKANLAGGRSGHPTIATIAAETELSRATVTREWQAARTWLYRRMTRTVTRDE